jgi:hypothetical protein
MINFSDAMASVLEPVSPVSPVSPEGAVGANTGASKGKGITVKAGNSGGGGVSNGGGNNSNGGGNGGSSGANGTSSGTNNGVSTSDGTRPPLAKDPSTNNVIGKVALVVSNLHKALLEQREALRDQQAKMDEQLAAIVDIQKFLSDLPQA